MKYLLGIDFGGGASKATLLCEDGSIVCENTVEYPTLHPEPLSCEQDSSDWIDALCRNTRAMIEKSGVLPESIAAVAIDSATHTFLPCDGDYKPLYNAIHWTDSRSRAEAQSLREEHGDEIFKKTYHKPDTIWTLPQLIWLKKNRADVFANMKRIFFEKDYIRFFLTDVYCTDYIEAEGSMLFNLEEKKWDKELCDLCGIDISMLPPIVAPDDIVGSVTEKASALTGLAAGTPVICGTTDTAMEVFASGAVEKGDMTVKLATAGRICVITDTPYPDRHIINYSHVVDGLWYPGTATKSAAASYRWYRDTFGGDYKELDRGASEISIGCEGLVFHPYLNGELTPYADPMLSGSFTGIRATHGKAHFTRAILEGVCLSLLDSKKYIDSLGVPHKASATVIGGGTKGDLWTQMSADVLGISLTRTESSDSSLGSAMLAGKAVGIFPDAKTAAKICVKVKDITYPNMENHEKYLKLFKKYKKLTEALSDIYHEDFDI